MKKSIFKFLAIIFIIGLLSACNEEEINPNEGFKADTSDGVSQDDTKF